MKRNRVDLEQGEAEEQKMIDVLDREREPKWFYELCAHANGEREYNDRPRFDDDTWEWDRCTYNEDEFYATRCIGNRTLPIGFMLNNCMNDWICDFLEMRPEISIHDPCCWIDDVPYTPLQRCWSHWCTLSDMHVPALWSAGVSAACIPCRILPSGLEDHIVRARINTCTQMEAGIMAMVWCCKQITDTSLHDDATTIAQRMRRMDADDWVDARKELDCELALLNDSDFECDLALGHEGKNSKKQGDKDEARSCGI